MKRPVITFNHEASAQEALQLLAENDILGDITAAKDKTKTLYAMEIDEPEHAEALELVLASEYSADAIHCPGCDSIAVEFPARPRASGLVNAMAIVADTVAPPEQQTFACSNCAKEWT